jgi:2-keto-3-deoxy-6-phosphogluconate aldolase
MDAILRQISEIGIIPIIKISDEGKAVPLAEALYKGQQPPRALRT